MKKKLMQLYKEWMETGRMPRYGLCDSIRANCGYRLAVFFDKKFKPDETNQSYWGYGKKNYWKDVDVFTPFTPLRQTLLLLLIEIVDD